MTHSKRITQRSVLGVVPKRVQSIEAASRTPHPALSGVPYFEIPCHEQPTLANRIEQLTDDMFEAFMFEQLPYLKRATDNERARPTKRRGLLAEFEVHAYKHGPRQADRIRKISSYSDRLGVFGQILMSGRYKLPSYAKFASSF